MYPTESWAQSEYLALLEFGARSKVEAGFGYLGPQGEIIAQQGAWLWINCRMTHMFSLAAIQGHPGAKELAEHGVNSLLTAFFDEIHGGWFARIANELDSHQRPVLLDNKDAGKAGYAHAFVLLAASSAKIAGINGAERLFDMAARNQEEHWWEESAGRVRESWDRNWTITEDYRGANANMHTVEAYLAAYDASGDIEWLRKAERISRALIDVHARANEWRLPEHYHADWTVDLDYNIDAPADPFRPWGATPGHGFEWARLITQLAAAISQTDLEVDLAWVSQAAPSMLATAYQGWAADGNPGIVYTTDFSGQAVCRQRMHWVVCEAIGAFEVLAKHFQGSGQISDARVEHWYGHRDMLREYLQTWIIEAPGQWRHELDENNHPSSQTWDGKPDIYHAGQCLLLADLPVTPGFALALKQAAAQQA